MAYKVFISSSVEDRKLTREIANRVKKAGAQPSLPDEVLIPGKDRRIRISEELRRSDEVVVIVTEHSAQSPWVNSEVGAALALGKRVIPVLDKVEPKDLPPILRSIKAIDVRDVERYIGQLSERIKSEAEDQETKKKRHILTG